MQQLKGLAGGEHQVELGVVLAPGNADDLDLDVHSVGGQFFVDRGNAGLVVGGQRAGLYVAHRVYLGLGHDRDRRHGQNQSERQQEQGKLLHGVSSFKMVVFLRQRRRIVRQCPKAFA